MKEKIKLYYNLDVLLYSDNVYYLDGVYYQLVKWERTDEELIDLIKICEELKYKKIKYNEIVLNLNGQYISDGYLLLKMNYFLDDEFNIKDLILYNEKLIVQKQTNLGWLEMWKNKVDYLEYQVKELAFNKKTIIASFAYYDGMAENAIALLNKVNSNNTRFCLSRLRVKYPNYCNDYFNPSNFIIDSRVRDVSEYIKNKFFSNKDVSEDLNAVFNGWLQPDEYNLFFIRMLYPSYYFDALEEVLLANKKEDLIINIVSKIDEYEELLRNIIKRVLSIIKIEYPSWLMKKE